MEVNSNKALIALVAGAMEVRRKRALIRLDSVNASRMNRAAELLLGDSKVLVYVEGRKIRLRPAGDDPVTMLTPVRRKSRGYRSGAVLGLAHTLREMGFQGRAHAEMRVVDGDIEIEVK